jgi:DsbC/DsbD-like thiol-disulfide interchange protein
MINALRSLGSLAGIVIATVLSVLPGIAALAQTLPLPNTPVRIALIQGSGDEAGLQIQLSPGWKFYWRTPGEGGVPAQFDWTASRNVARVDVAWPAPKRILIGKTEIYGYGGELVLPLRIERQDAAAPYGLDLMLDYGVCKDICILRNDRLLLRSQDTASTENQLLIAKWRAHVPQPAAQAGLQLVSHKLKPDRLIVTLQSQIPLQQPELFVEGTPDSWFGRPAVHLAANGLEVRFDLPAGYPPDKANQPLRLTLVDRSLQAELVLPP